MTAEERIERYEGLAERKHPSAPLSGEVTSSTPDKLLRPQKVTRDRWNSVRSLLLGLGLMSIATACTATVVAQAEVKPDIVTISRCTQTSNGRLESDDAINITISDKNDIVTGKRVVAGIGTMTKEGLHTKYQELGPLGQMTNVDLGAATFTDAQKEEYVFELYLSDTHNSSKPDIATGPLVRRLISSDCYTHSPQRAFSNSR